MEREADLACDRVVHFFASTSVSFVSRLRGGGQNMPLRSGCVDDSSGVSPLEWQRRSNMGIGWIFLFFWFWSYTLLLLFFFICITPKFPVGKTVSELILY